ncbi:hypothetical protein [Nocardia sp. NPDC048505]|uniref:hypothetical protein n=1 Tax=unclassified Nocardia TaxID=2637762 RepID=UPI0033E85255
MTPGERPSRLRAVPVAADPILERVRGLVERARLAGYVLSNSGPASECWELLYPEDGVEAFAGDLDQIERWIGS